MAITTVQILSVEGGVGEILYGQSTGDSTRTVTLSATTTSNEYRFVGWEIVVDASSTGTGDSTGGTGIGGGGGGGGGGADTFFDTRI